jgi:hypothetical protein
MYAVFDFWCVSTDETEIGSDSDPDLHEKDYKLTSIPNKKQKKSQLGINGDSNLS